MFEEHLHLVVSCFVEHSPAELLEVRLGHVTSPVRTVHVEQVFRLVATLDHDFVDVLDELNGVNSLELLHELLVSHVVIAVGVDVFVQRCDLIIIHFHL
jgi:hypothetical protein